MMGMKERIKKVKNNKGVSAIDCLSYVSCSK